MLRRNKQTERGFIVYDLEYYEDRSGHQICDGASLHGEKQRRRGHEYITVMPV
jgi:hypothetical protein